jgi:bla regulator protein blaR1
MAPPILVGATPLPRPLAPTSIADQFEVASVKPNVSGTVKTLIQPQPGGRFTATNVTLRQLIQHAYQLQDFQVSGGPAWLARDHFDIVAKADAAGLGDPFQPGKGGGPSRGQLMLRALLAERFMLEIHTEAKESQIYALALARSDGALGPQLKRSTGDCAPTCAMRIFPGTILAGVATLAELAGGLSTLVGHVVVDRTGLGDAFTFTLRWTPDQVPQGFDRKARGLGLPAIDPEGPALFTAVKEQLGLKLDSQKGPVDILVVDRAERPKEN